MTVGEELDRIQDRLNDRTAAIWSREELAQWWNDSYRDLCTVAAVVVRLRCLDLPGRHSHALTFDWEATESTGTVWAPMLQGAAGSRRFTSSWESEHLERVTPSQGFAGLTYEWERAHLESTDRRYEFALPKNHERLKRVAWNNRKLFPVSVRELDASSTSWQRRIGLPRWWTTGTGRVRSLEVYQIEATYQQGYAQNSLLGLPRALQGARSYGILCDGPQATNLYAYTGRGDVQAVVREGAVFAPITCYTQSWESAYGRAPRYNFTINLTMNEPRLRHTVVFPWEMGAVGGPVVPDDGDQADQEDSFIAIRSNAPVALNGLARLLTHESASLRAGTQVWEQEFLNGASSFSTGAVVGAFTWENRYGAAAFSIPLGTVRGAESPDRQYLPVESDATLGVFQGRVSDWRSSDEAISVHEVVLPDQQLVEADTPAHLPRQLLKYVRYAVLARCFGRDGEGHNTILADHYNRRASQGALLFKNLGLAATSDRRYQRNSGILERQQMPRVRLPSTFERVW